MDPRNLTRVLAEIADIASETLDLQEVFDRVATSVRELIPFDHMGVVRIVGDDRAVAHASTVPCPAGDGSCSEPALLSDWSPRIRPRPAAIARVEDAELELDRAYPHDAKILDAGCRSSLWEPFRSREAFTGGVWLSSYRPHAFTDLHQEILVPVAALLGSVLSHHRLAEEVRVAAEERERASRLEATVETLTRELEVRGRGRIVGVSRSWKAVLRQVGRVAPSETTVLITGESGTGKEVVARMIHQGSPRGGSPFVAINCAALPEQLLESELFGHERGAFTGALTTKIGRIEQAAGGTLFLDEIAEMSPMLQAKLLRVLQEREFQRLGSTRTLRADARVLAATNRDLSAAIARGAFREDLYYRLNVFEIALPPLRDRPEDVLPLAESFLDELGPTMPRPAAGISRDAREWLLAYPWPGNVRELRNAVERGILLCDGGLITREHLPAVVGRPEEARASNGHGSGAWDGDGPLPPGGVDLDQVERGYVEKALDQTRGNRSKAARLLGITRAQLYSRLDKYGLR